MDGVERQMGKEREYGRGWEVNRCKGGRRGIEWGIGKKGDEIKGKSGTDREGRGKR